MSSEAVYVSVANSFHASSLCALRASDGAQLWCHKMSAASEAVANGALYVTTPEGFVCALQVSDGTQLWCHQTNLIDVVAMVATEVVAIVGAGPRGTACALRVNDGAQLWCYPTDSKFLLLAMGSSQA